MIDNQERTYKIHENHMEELEKKLKRIFKKCAKYGVGYSYEVLDSEFINVESDKKKEPNYQKFYIIKTSGEAKINNWEFIAVLEPMGDMNIIKRYNTEVELPERFRNAENVCEHCNTKRNRKELFVVRNTETNEFKQIGRQCLMEYTNGLSAEFVANYMEWKDIFSGYEDDSADWSSMGGSYRNYYEVKEILSYAIVITQHFGFRKSEDENSTVSRVQGLVWDMMKTLEEWYRNENRDIKKSDFYTDEVESKANEIVEYYLELDDNSEFIHNVKTILREHYVGRKQFGIISCLPYCYNKAMERVRLQDERKLENENTRAYSKHFGEIGKRYAVQDVTLSCITSFETYYGLMSIYKFIDVDNNVFIWKTGTYKDTDKKYSITFTVKGHTEYDGIEQTEVTRCRLIEVEKNKV